MPQLKIMGFDGVVPRTSATMLGENQAQIAEDVKLYSKELRYWRGSTTETYVPPAGTTTLYKYYYNVYDDYKWLTWADDVNVVRGPIADTSDYRLYYTGDGVPKKTYNTLATTGSGPYPAASLNMGVPAPTGAPAVTRIPYTRTVTITIASPAVVTLAAHGLADGDTVVFSTTGALPTGLTAGNTYYVKNATTNTFEVTATSSGTSVNTSGTQSGVHSIAVTTNPENRVYVYTYVSTFGGVSEESAPSPASTILTLYTGDTVTINGFTAPPTSGYNITSRRIYRSVTGATTDSYLFVAEIPLATTSYTDSLTAEQLGEALSTIGWVPPPSDMAGLVSHPSGALAGFSGNTVYFSEPFYPHAWPLAYAISIPDRIIGLGIFGTSIVVMTDRNPYIITGSYPGAMSSERVPILEPCVSKPSIYSDEYGVVYASPNGMVGIGPQSRGVITNNLFAYNEWVELQPQLLAGVVTNNQYFAIYPENVDDLQTMVINRTDVPALSFVSMQASAVHIDSKTSHLYYVDALNGRIQHWDNDELNPLPYVWKSKRFVMPQATTFSALKLDGDYDQIGDATIYNQLAAEINARNTAKFSGDILGPLNSTEINYSYYDAAITSGHPYHGIEMNGSTLETVPPLASVRSAQVTLYADGVKITPSLDMTTFDPIRIPPFKSRAIEVQVTGTLNVRSVALATTVTELHQ
jgi:hypothetical protein